MASRLITDETSKSNKLPLLSADALNVFFLIIPHLSVHGKMIGDPHYVKGRACPKYKRLTPDKIAKCLKEISETTNVKWFQIDGLWYIHSLNFKEHQPGLRDDRAGKDILPDYPGENPQVIDNAQLRENSGSSPGVLPPRKYEVEEEVEVGRRSMKRDIPPAPEPEPEPEEKKQYGEFKNVLLTDSEFTKLSEKYGTEATALIERLSAGIASKGYKYKSHYATILNWSRKDEKPTNRAGPPGLGTSRTAGNYQLLEKIRREHKEHDTG